MKFDWIFRNGVCKIICSFVNIIHLMFLNHFSHYYYFEIENLMANNN